MAERVSYEKANVVNINDQKQQAITNGVRLELRRPMNAHRRRRRKYWQGIYKKLCGRTAPKEFRALFK